MLELCLDVLEHLSLAAVVRSTLCAVALHVYAQLLKPAFHSVDDLVFTSHVLRPINISLDLCSQALETILHCVKDLLGVATIRSGILFELSTHAVDELMQLL